MPTALVDVVAVAALAVLLAVAYAHPPAWAEAAAGLVAAGMVLVTGGVGWSRAGAELRLLAPVVLFLVGILVVAEVCAAAGLFAAVGSRVARAGRGDPVRMLRLTFVAAAVTTAVLSLDATVVLLTPVVAAAATTTRTSPRPVVLACARLANSASLLLPVSNLTNLLALPALPSLSFVGFAVVMAPVWLVVLLVEYVGHRLFFRRDLHRPPSTSGPGAVAGVPPAVVRLPVVPVLVVGLMLVAFAALSPLGVEPAWVACAGALVLVGNAMARRQLDLRAAVRSANPSFAVFVLGLGVVVAGLSRSFLGDLVARTLPAGDGLGALLLVAVVATLLANLVNNLPATLLLVPLVAPLGTTAVLAALVGLGVGSGLTYTGSLANLLWRRTLLARGEAASGRDFHVLSALVTLPAVGLGVLVLWAWAPLVR